MLKSLTAVSCAASQFSSAPACLLARPRSYYHSEAELHRLFKSVNGIIFPGGLTDLWMDSPCERSLLAFCLVPWMCKP